MSALVSRICREATCVYQLRGGDTRMAQNLLDDADLDALLGDKRGGGVPSVVGESS
jgi:hypothetical protein